MIPNLVAIALTRLGTPHEIGTQLAINSIHTKHKVITGHGLSTQSIECHHNKIWSGIDQGNSVSGPAWIALEAAKIATYDIHETKSQTSSPNRTIKYNNSLIAYVDDNNTTLTFRFNTQASEIIYKNNINTKNGIIY